MWLQQVSSRCLGGTAMGGWSSLLSGVCTRSFPVLCAVRLHVSTSLCLCDYRSVLIVTMRERQRLKTFPTILESVATQCNTDIRPRQIALLNLPPQLRLAFLRALGLLSASRLFAFVSSILFVFVRGRRRKVGRWGLLHCGSGVRRKVL